MQRSSKLFVVLFYRSDSTYNTLFWRGSLSRLFSEEWVILLNFVLQRESSYWNLFGKGSHPAQLCSAKGVSLNNFVVTLDGVTLDNIVHPMKPSRTNLYRRRSHLHNSTPLSATLFCKGSHPAQLCSAKGVILLNFVLQRESSCSTLFC